MCRCLWLFPLAGLVQWKGKWQTAFTVNNEGPCILSSLFIGMKTNCECNYLDHIISDILILTVLYRL